jgi:hypothetical protein
VRTFRNPAKAIEILHQMGAHRVEIDTSAWSPAESRLAGRKRPDTSDRQRRAHRAAAHDAWFQEQVQLAVQEADHAHALWDTQAEVKKQSKTKRATWARAAKKADKAAV